MFFAKAFVIVRLSIPAKLAISILALTHYQLSYFQATVRLSSSGCGLWCYWLYGPSIWFWALNKASGASVMSSQLQWYLYIHFGTIVARGSRTRSSNVRFWNIRFVLDIYGQQFWEYICWYWIYYWIYHAIFWGMNVSWTVSERPSGLERVSHAVRMSHAVRTLEPNQPKDNVTPIHTLWDNCCTRFEDTQLECTFLKYKICTGYMLPTV